MRAISHSRITQQSVQSSTYTAPPSFARQAGVQYSPRLLLHGPLDAALLSLICVL